MPVMNSNLDFQNPVLYHRKGISCDSLISLTLATPRAKRGNYHDAAQRTVAENDYDRNPEVI